MIKIIGVFFNKSFSIYFLMYCLKGRERERERERESPVIGYHHSHSLVVIVSFLLIKQKLFCNFG